MRKNITFWTISKFSKKIAEKDSLAEEYLLKLKFDIREYNEASSKNYRGKLTKVYKKMIIKDKGILSKADIELIGSLEESYEKSLLLGVATLLNRIDVVSLLLANEKGFQSFNSTSKNHKIHCHNCAGKRATKDMVLPPLASMAVLNNNINILKILKEKGIDMKDANGHAGKLAKKLKRKKLFPYLKMSLKDKLL